MKKIAQFLHFDKGRHAGQRRKTRAQSLVEFAITLPVLVLLFSGLVEFGFALNYYLSLLDATRETARYNSNFDPFLDDGTDDPNFYSLTAAMAVANLDPLVANPDYVGRRIVLDSAEDDVLVTVFAWSEDGGVARYPTSGTFQLYHNSTSRFTDADIANRFALQPGSPSAVFLLVEVHYNYRQKLAIPFLESFVPNPMFLRAYTIMPLSVAQPVEAVP